MLSITRSRALGALTALGMFGALRGTATAAGRADPDDVKLLNTALSLELATVKMYGDAASANLLSPNVVNVTNQFAADHAAHRDALIAQLQQFGQTPTSDAAPLQAPAMKTEADFLSFALAAERQLATTYLAAIPQFKNRDLAKTAASILGVDTAHVALLSEALRQNPAYPGGFVS